MVPNIVSAVISADYTVVNEGLVLVELGTEEVAVTLPAANQGDAVTIVVHKYTSGPGTNNVVKVFPDPMTSTNKINGLPFVEVPFLRSTMTLYGVGIDGWVAI